MRHGLRTLLLLAILASPLAQAQPTDFDSWLAAFRQEAATQGISAATLDSALTGVTPNEKVIELDRRQPEFLQTFLAYLERRTTPRQIERGQARLAEHAALLDEVEQKYGIPKAVLVAFWSLETNYGAYLGGFNIPASLATLAFDGPGQGEAEYDLPLRHDYEVPVGAVIDLLESRDDVDAARVGLWGRSLGGHLVVRAAAFEPRVRACVSLSGSYRVLDTWEKRPGLNRMAYVVRSHSSSEEEAAERLAAFDLAGVTERVTCPMYVVGGTADRLTSHEVAVRIAAEVRGPVQLNVIEGGTHTGSNKPYAYRPEAADWLTEVLSA
jgi:dienelactone hydrolase